MSSPLPPIIMDQLEATGVVGVAAGVEEAAAEVMAVDVAAEPQEQSHHKQEQSYQ